MANETSKTTSPGNASPTPQQIPLAQIRDLPGIVNIRTYTPKDLGGLVSSIQSVGVREPIIVRRSEDGMYQLLAGQRRRKASELAKKTTIPALVYEMTLEEARFYPLIGKRHAVQLSSADGGGKAALLPRQRPRLPQRHAVIL